MSLAEEAIDAVERHPAVRRVRLVGSRAEGRATPLSDWDFVVETEEFAAVAPAMAALIAPLQPLAQQWDRLSETYCWMVMMPGPMKLDFIFAEPHEDEPPWKPDRSNLGGVDRHCWDWVLWLQSKQANNKRELVAHELKKLFDHILHPMGVESPPHSLEDAVANYLAARERFEQRLGMVVPRELGDAVLPVLSPLS